MKKTNNVFVNLSTARKTSNAKKAALLATLKKSNNK